MSGVLIYFLTRKMNLFSNRSQRYFSNIKIISLEEFHSLKSEWNSLLSESKVDNFFLTHEWLSTWVKYFSSDQNSFILIARDSKTHELLGAAPLIIEQCRNALGLSIKKLVFMGNGCLEIDHLDFIIKKGFETEISRDFINGIQQHKNKWDIIFFDGLASSSKALSGLLDSSHIKLHLTYTESCPYLTLPDNWESLRQQFGKNLRYNLGRYKRKLEKAYPGMVEFRRVETEDELGLVMPKLCSLHNLVQMTKNEHHGIFEDKNIADFHNDISNSSLASGNLHLYSLSVEDKIIAVLYCFRHKDAVLFYQTGYDPQWKEYSPGRLLMAYAIENSISEEVKEFDFLRGSESYKSAWTNESREEFRFYLASSLKGHLSLMPLLIRKNLRTFLNAKNKLSFLSSSAPNSQNKTSQTKPLGL